MSEPEEPREGADSPEPETPAEPQDTAASESVPEASSSAPAPEVSPAEPGAVKKAAADPLRPRPGLELPPAIASTLPPEEQFSGVGTMALFLSAFLIATCGLIYELVSGAMASYLLGDSITQFSLVIGFYLSAMGVGSYLSKYVYGDLLVTFLRVEVAVGIVGGFSSLMFFASYAYLGTVRPVLFTTVAIIGTLVGLEIPVLMRVLKDEVSFNDLVARVLAFDYLGALAASLAFPLLLVPKLGLPRTAFAFGILNAFVAFILTIVFRERLGVRRRSLQVLSLGATAILITGFVVAEQFSVIAERHIYDAPVLIKKKTPYQTIVVTRHREDIRLMLDGHLQFSSVDERRYHEALVHPAVAAVQGPIRSALVLGGGDGMALRELLRYPSVERVTLVDLDPAITGLFKTEPMLAALNENAYADPRVTVVNADAMKWIEGTTQFFDVVCVDFPDPRSYALSKLYTRGMYRLIHRHLARGGALAIQATTPYGPPKKKRLGSKAYWCIVRTMEDAGFTCYPYHCYVPAFGDWGFVLALPNKRAAPQALKTGFRGKLSFLNDSTMRGLFAIPEDLLPPKGLEVNRLNNQILVKYYESEWGARLGGSAN